MSNPDRPTVETLLAHSEFVRGLARTLVSDPATADDAVQQAWLAACEAPPADARSPRGWLATVTRNVVRKRKRGEARRDAREEAVARPEASVPSAAAIAEREEARRKLVDAVLGLEEPYRSAIVLRYLEELPPREVAARLDVPVETARTRIKRGLEQLRGVLDTKFAGRTAWGLALIPLAMTGGTAKAAAGVGLGVAVAAAAALLIGGVIAAEAFLSGHAARGSQPPLSPADAAWEAAPDQIEVPEWEPRAQRPVERDEFGHPISRDARRAQAEARAKEALRKIQARKAEKAAVAAGLGHLQLRATVEQAFVPFEGALRMTAHFENRGGGVVKFFTPRFADIDSFPEWRLHHEDGRLFAPTPWMGQSTWKQGLAGTLHELEPGGAWTRTLEVRRVVAAKPDGSFDWQASVPPPPGRYRVTCRHTQADNKLPHNRSSFRQESVAVPGVWTGSLAAPELWVTVGPATQPSLAVTTADDMPAGGPCWINLQFHNPTRAPLVLGSGTVSVHSKMHGGGTVTLPAEALSAAGGAALPSPLEVAPGETLRARVDLARRAFVPEGRKPAPTPAGLYELVPRGPLFVTVSWTAGEAPDTTTLKADAVTLRIAAPATLPELTLELREIGRTRVEVRLLNRGTAACMVQRRLSWPADLLVSCVDASHDAKTSRAVQGRAFTDWVRRFELGALKRGLAWDGDRYERPAPLAAADFGRLEPGQSIARELDLNALVAGGLPAGRYRVSVRWRGTTDGRHLELASPAVTGTVVSESIEIVVE